MRIILFVLFALLIGARSLAHYVIEFEWWKELGQVETWLDMLSYSILPAAAATLLAFAGLWVAHARGLKFSGPGLRQYPFYGRITTLALMVLAFLIAVPTLDSWDIMRWWGARGLPPEAKAWHDPVFGQPLKFYLFDLPFYSSLRSFLLAATVGAALTYFLTARAWQFIREFPKGGTGEIDLTIFRFEGGFESRFLRILAAIFFLALGWRYYLGRYEMVWNDHGFMVGIDYVDQNIGLPLQWVVIAACAAAAAFSGLGLWRLLLVVPAALILKVAIPGFVGSFYVRPNEISLERPYIEQHIQATRQAYGLGGNLKELEFKAKPDAPIDTVKNKVLLDNVRLWDWSAFHDTVTQIQSLRPYYTFFDSDVDRYMIDGQYRQVLLTPRELDIRQLPDARTRWINPHFIYTHGYGVVLAEVARITPDGLPLLLVQNAPPEIKTPSLKLTRPEIYFGEVVHEPVFVHTEQAEFNYPSGDTNVQSRYEGKGGFPISSFAMRAAAALREGEINILLTGYLTPSSRMIIRRNVRARLQALAEFLAWDVDPYLVITEEGRLVWMIDGYTTSDSHPYSKRIDTQALGTLNYMRNAVKATVDAYDGETKIYVFDPADPVIRVWQSLFPKLFHPAAEMPAGLRFHARYPETLFRVQAEIYRTFHMKDPQAFYNKEDLWDLAKYTGGQAGQAKAVTPTYIFAAAPGSDKPEFLLLLPFTPRSKDNLISLMVARCDGEHLGELLVLELSKQELIFGPLQVSARINQDQNISKDLTLWNQQGSQVLRGQTLTLPIDNTILYIDPIYIQANQARMPQLKKVVIAQGNSLIYADTYEQALAQLSGNARAAAVQALSAAPAAASTAAAPAAAKGDARLERIRQHLRRYRELTGQGKLSEAGRELEAIEAEAR